MCESCLNLMQAEVEAELIAGSPIIDVPIQKLRLDSGNVRFRHYSPKPNSKKVEEIIRRDDDTSELCEQIFTSGVVYEPLVINSEYIVIEGNRRLVCLRMLYEQAAEGKLEGITKEKFAKVRCRILPKAVNDKTLDLYLATIHVKGKKPWKLFNRAKHIYRLNRIHGMPYDYIASYLGMGKVTIQRSILVYLRTLDYERAFPDDNEWFHKFTYFEELFRRKELEEFADQKDFVRKFSHWVHDGKFLDHRQVRQLRQVLSKPDAYEAFLKGNFNAALKVLEKEDPSLSDPDFKRIRTTIDVLKSISRNQLYGIKANPAKMKLLISLEAEVKNLIVELDAMRTLDKGVESQ